MQRFIIAIQHGNRSQSCVCLSKSQLSTVLGWSLTELMKSFHPAKPGLRSCSWSSWISRHKLFSKLYRVEIYLPTTVKHIPAPSARQSAPHWLMLIWIHHSSNQKNVVLPSFSLQFWASSMSVIWQLGLYGPKLSQMRKQHSNNCAVKLLAG